MSIFWLREWENERALSLKLDKLIDYYNRYYLHSALVYKTQAQAEAEFYNNKASHKNDA